jgi:23S rRNA (pseudouridine1915-N3)-methyltransferase
MKVLIISPGKAHDHTVAQGIAEYEKRVSGRLPLEWVMPRADTPAGEGGAIQKIVKKDDYVVLLDERGKDIDTPGLAALLERRMRESTKRIVFIIGGAFGVSEEIRARADTTIRLSSLVFPHMLARLILVEQLYRAVSIIDGGKYHHA